MDYSEIQAAICSYVQNYETSFVANIPTFVQNAEKRIYSSIQFPVTRNNQTGTITASNKYLSVPTDPMFQSVYSMAVILASGAQAFLIDKDVNFIREAYPNPTSTGVPKYYALFDADTFIMGPTADIDYGVELHYYAYPESIVTATNTWLGDTLPNLLLYGALREAAVFMKEEADVIAMYEGMYGKDLHLAKQLGDGKNRMDSYRNGQVRAPVE